MSPRPGTYLGRKQTSISRKLETKKNDLKKDLHKLQDSIYTIYENLASNILVQIFNLNKNSKNLTAVIDKHGDDVLRKIDTAIKELESDLNDIETENLTVLNKQEEEIKSVFLKSNRSSMN